jgi:tetratricopeptide (TPR) repeat protein
MEARLKDALDLVKDPSARVTRDQLQYLVDYECWSIVELLIDRVLPTTEESELPVIVHAIRAEAKLHDNPNRAALLGQKLIQLLKMNFFEFQTKILREIDENIDPLLESQILELCYQNFIQKNCQVSALERLAHLYEKRIFNDQKLHEICEKIIKIDKNNLRALKYFKIIYSQSNNWAAVVEILNLLIDSTEGSQGQFRFAQELAGVYLYQLDQPEKSLSVLDEYCQGSHLDTSTIKIDAYQRLGKWKSCIEVIRECMLRVDSDSARSVLQFKIAQMEERMGNTTSSVQSYDQAIEIFPRFFEAYEEKIQLLKELKDWKAIAETLNALNKATTLKDLQTDLSELQKRIGARP